MRNPLRWLWPRRIPDIPPGRVSIVDLTDTGEIIMGPTDMLGRPIQVFSRIVYPGAYLRNKVQTVIARVTEIKDGGGLVVEVERRSRDNDVRRRLVTLSADGVKNVVVLG